jgi:hypothetical protein
MTTTQGQYTFRDTWSMDPPTCSLSSMVEWPYVVLVCRGVMREPFCVLYPQFWG